MVAAIAVTSDNYIAQDNLGEALLERGEVDAALSISRLRQRLRRPIRPAYSRSRCTSNRGRIFPSP